MRWSASLFLKIFTGCYLGARTVDLGTFMVHSVPPNWYLGQRLAILDIPEKLDGSEWLTLIVHGTWLRANFYEALRRNSSLLCSTSIFVNTICISSASAVCSLDLDSMFMRSRRHIDDQGNTHSIPWHMVYFSRQSAKIVCAGRSSTYHPAKCPQVRIPMSASVCLYA
jgi:hypothetical protein